MEFSNRENYWRDKISLFLHDPIHKAFKIRGHEEKAQEIADILWVKIDKEDYKIYDQIASALTRAALPGHSSDTLENGSVNFLTNPELTHPLVKSKITIRLPEKIDDDRIHAHIKELIQKDTEFDINLLDISEEKNVEEKRAKTVYFYLFFIYKKRLISENVCGISSLWEFIPADTRLPDHSIWHHCALTSAIGSSIAYDNDKDISLAVFSITPVQSFISKARKLRDMWTGSIILSYLSFIGIREVMNNLGPDHIIYPSLHDQLLVEQWLEKKFRFKSFLKYENEISKNSSSIASFPNKFVFICASSMAEEILKQVENAVQKEWLRIASKVCDFIGGQLNKNNHFVNLFNQQISDYWQYSWAASKLVRLNEDEKLRELLSTNKWKREAEVLKDFAKQYPNSGEKIARLYGSTHSLIQTVLAATKLVPNTIRKTQKNKKCPLCGEHEVLHNFDKAGETSANEYNKEVNKFWDGLRAKFNSDASYSQIGKKECLCAVCAVKRFLPIVMKTDNSELLYNVFGAEEAFPSTTEVAAHRYIKELSEKVNITKEKKRELINILHNSELENDADENLSSIKEIMQEGKDKGVKFTDRDKYYAILLMDGDNMGDLINGQTLSTTWDDVIHSELSERFKNPNFSRSSSIRSHLNNKRILNPALHAAISHSLNCFARMGVAPTIQAYDGRLIYAGGDDLCAALPLDNVLEVAHLISKFYGMKFVKYGDKIEEISKETDTNVKFGMHLGHAEKISISGAIIIAHYKEPLREVIRDAHFVLEHIAKQKAGKNALAIRLKKRSGGDRDFYFKWNETNRFLPKESIIDSFYNIMSAIKNYETSSTLLYKLSQLKEAIRPLALTDQDIDRNKDKIIKLFEYEIEHSNSGKKSSANEYEKEQNREVAARLAGLCIKSNSSDPEWFNPESVIISRFMALKKESI